MTPIEQLDVKIFADGADLTGIRELAANPMIKGFTTNPTLMRKAGIDDYEAFARQVLDVVTDRPVSFEVFADDLDEMERQAVEIASWGGNVNVKIPVTNTAGQFSGALISHLSEAGIKVNVTANMTLDQIERVVQCLDASTPAFVSMFAGRIADTGRDPVPIMREAVDILRRRPEARLIWASPRELLNIYHAEQAGCHVITATSDLLDKIALVGKDLTRFSLETVKMFHDDARNAGYVIDDGRRAAAED